MYGLLHPAMLQGARWYVNQATYATLFTSGYTAIDKTFGQLTILGLPVEVHPFMSAPADNKHIMLGNFKGFAFGYKSPSVVNSLHIKYLTNEQVFRVLLRIGGNVVVSTSACEDGVSRGAFVIPA
jgi:HK97 family phage major capsid protein